MSAIADRPRPSAVPYDPRERGVIDNPYPMLHRLQDAEPAHWSEFLRGWVLTRYDDVKMALHDGPVSADRVSGHMEGLGDDERAANADLDRVLAHWVVFTDPPDHTRLRALMNKGFTTRALDALRPGITRLVDHMVVNLIDARGGGGEVDFIAHFAYPLPATVIALMLGVPPNDVNRFRAWSDDLAAFVGVAVGDPGRRARAQLGAAELADYFGQIIAERRANPPPAAERAIIDDLIAAEEAGDQLSGDELVSACVLLLFAGHETTTNLLGNGLLALLRHPDELARWRADPDGLAVSAVEELLRYDGPIGAMTRVVRAPWPIGDAVLEPGDRVFAMVNAANRDPRRFADPDGLDLARPDNRHIAFGYGIHFCIGAPLARMEVQIALPALLRRLPEIELATDAPDWDDSLILRGLKSLPIRAQVA